MERRFALRTAATGVLAGLAFGVGTAWAQLPQPQVPDVQVPDVPSVQVPQVPSVPAPAPVPQVPRVPEVPQVPEVPRSVEPAPAPVPSVSVPRTPATSGGGGGGGGGGSSSSGSSGSGGGGGSSSSSSSASGGGGGGGTTSAARPAAGGGDEGDGGGQAAPRRRSTAQRRGRSGVVREQRLRKTVHRLAGCLDDLRLAPRRVLVLRSGYGPATPLSRSQVGDRLDFAAPRVKRLERRGLRRLRALRRHGGCAGGPAALADAGAGGDNRVAAALGVGEDTSGGSDGGRADGVADAVKTGLSAPASAVKDLFETSPSASSDTGQSSTPPATVVPQPSDGIGIWTLLAFFTGLGLLGFAVKRELSA